VKIQIFWIPQLFISLKNGIQPGKKGRRYKLMPAKGDCHSERNRMK
jgi:hypothetical protein